MRRIDPSEILRYYRSKVPAKPMLTVPGELAGISCWLNGLGDAMICTRIPSLARKQGRRVHIAVKSRHFGDLSRYIPDYEPPPEGAGPWPPWHGAVENYQLGGGHHINRVERLMKVQGPSKPRGALNIPRDAFRRGRVGLHLWTSDCERSRTRRLDERSWEILRNFVRERTEYEFVQFGGPSDPSMPGAESWLGRTVDDSVNHLASCEFLICVNSGFMNVAAALDIKTVVILNQPDPADVCLPYIVDWVESVHMYAFDLGWLYPQQVMLHQRGEGPTCPRFTAESLLAALQGEIYPYWSDDYLDLLHADDRLFVPSEVPFPHWVEVPPTMPRGF